MNTDSTHSGSWQNGQDSRHNHWQKNDYFAWAKAPGFNPMKLAAVVAGFAIFPPIGAAALLYFIWNSRRGWGGPAYAMGEGHRHNGCGRGRGRGRWTGNAAFDEHQAEVMQNLRAEREAFHGYREEQRRNRDRQAYDGFRAAQAEKPETPKAD